MTGTRSISSICPAPPPTTGCTSGIAPTPLWRRWTATASYVSEQFQTQITNQERLYLENIGGTAALRASVAVENGDAVPITWTTSNPAAATVDPFGLVTAVGDGEALITATTPDGHSACCNVYCGTQVAIQEQIEADEAKIALGVLGGFAVLVGALALAVSGS